MPRGYAPGHRRVRGRTNEGERIVGRLFGTDGVRGLANADLTAELALDLAVAAAHVLGDVGRVRRSRGPAGGRRRARHPGVRGVPRGGRRRRARERRGRRLARRGAAHPRHRVPHRGARRRPRRGALREPQPDAGQRHQALRAWRPQARRRRRGRHRDAHERGVARVRPAPASAASSDHAEGPSSTSSTCSRRSRTGSTGSPSSSTARTVRRPRRARGAAPRGRRRRRDPRDARRPQHQRRLRLDAPRRPAWPPSSSTGPTRASPTTATPTAASPSTRAARWSTATRSLAILGLAMRERGVLAHDTVVATVMANLGFQLAMQRDGAHRGRDRRGRPLRARGDARRRLRRSAASSAAT